MVKSMRADWMPEEKTAEALAPEEDILTAACNGHWARALAKIKALGRPMDRSAAELCLEYGLQNAPAAVFGRLLEMLPKGETTGSIVVRSSEKKLYAELTGTLVMLAAAQGMTEKLECLLAHGWDVNGVSLDAAHRLRLRGNRLDPFYRTFGARVEPLAPCSESHVRLMSESEGDFMPYAMQNRFLGVTPLAAAILCGQQACVRVLLDHGAWKEEAPSVAQVLMSRERAEDEAFQACREAVLTYGDAPRPMALWAVVRTADEEQLEEELNRCVYSEEAVARAVWEMGINCRMMPFRGRWAEERQKDFRRLQVLERHYPQVVRRPELAGLLLHWGMGQNYDEETMNHLVDLCPEQLDISILREVLVRSPVRKTCRLLRRLCEGRSCTMDRDSVSPGTSVMVLQTLLKYVDFLPPASGRSISGLSYAILNSGNIRLVRKALETGILPAEEPTDLLLRCMGDSGCSTMARSLLLTVPRQEAGIWTGHRKVLPHGPMFRWMPPEFRKSGYGALLEEDCPVELEWELVMRGLYDYRGDPEYETAEGRWKVESPLTLLCCMGRTRAVERWVRCAPEDTVNLPSSIRPAGEAYTLRGTPLCVAAFAGQKETVEMLLALGAEVNEQDNSIPSTLIPGEDRDFLPITPLLAAIVQGHWEIARVLLDHGAVCDLKQACVRQLWDLFQTEDLHQTVQLHLRETAVQQSGLQTT